MKPTQKRENETNPKERKGLKFLREGYGGPYMVVGNLSLCGKWNKK